MGALGLTGVDHTWILSALGAGGSGGADPFAATSDEALMTLYRKGDGDAFEALYRRHGAPLHRFIARLLRNGRDADEIYQEVWFAVIRGRERYEPTARFVTFLFAIAHRRVADHARKAMRGAPLAADALEDCPDGDLDPHASLQNAQLGEALLAAIDALPLAQRAAFLLQAEAGLSLEEIARATEVPRETVKSRLRYASRHLRHALKDWK